MEFIEGHSLAELLREREPKPANPVMSLLVQVAEGLVVGRTFSTPKWPGQNDLFGMAG